MIELRSNIRLWCNIEIIVYDVLSNTGRMIRTKNLVVDAGLNLVRDLLGGTGFRPSHVGVGTGATAPVAGDTSIQTEVFRGLVTRRDSLSKAIKYQFFLGTADANGNTLTEVGLLQTGFQNDAPLDPALLVARATYAGQAKTPGVEITYNWTLNIAGI